MNHLRKVSRVFTKGIAHLLVDKLGGHDPRATGVDGDVLSLFECSYRPLSIALTTLTTFRKSAHTCTNALTYEDTKKELMQLLARETHPRFCTTVF
jgi:hypothetical protein